MQFLKRHKVLFSVLLMLILSISVYQVTKKPEVPNWTIDTISTGTVRELVSVSGVIEAESEASLSFPLSGTVGSILVKDGDRVEEGAVLATLEYSELLAERRDAEAALMIADADQRELQSGPRTEERDVTSSLITIARSHLEKTVREERVKVDSAYFTLLSSDLEAVPKNANTAAEAPTITGTYTCTQEGVYIINFFRSSSESGYSYRLSGLETGSGNAYSEAPAPLGMCGLRMQIDADSTYGTQTWLVSVPNTTSATYPTLMTAYVLAQEVSENAIIAAQDALMKAEREAVLSNATPREEEVARSEAARLQASARLAAIDARIKDRTLTAPFAGIVSDVDMTKGEASTGRSIALIGSNTFVLTVRIPEIDITKVALGQSALANFDARQGETLEGYVSFIAPVAREIDGVAYFEAHITFTTPPEWMRSGLNADVDIIVDEHEESLRAPKRFIVTDTGASYLLYPEGATTTKRAVDILFTGNDGFVSIAGDIHEGDTIVAP